MFSPGVGSLLTLLIDISFPTLGNLIKKILKLFCQIPNPCPHSPPPRPPTGFTLIGALLWSRVYKPESLGLEQDIVFQETDQLVEHFSLN